MPAAPLSLRSGRLPAGARQAASARAGQVTYGVANFKSIASAEITPHRLTILAGANSSGKSSLLQALLFVAQSIGEPTTVLNGDLVQLGEPHDVLRDETSSLILDFRYGDEPVTLQVALGALTDVSLAVEELTLTAGSDLLLHAGLASTASGAPSIYPDESLLAVTPDVNHGFNEPVYLTIVGLLPRRLILRADMDLLNAGIERSIETLGTSPMVTAQQYARMAQQVGGHEELVALLTAAMRSSRDEAIKQLVALGAERRDELFILLRAAEAPDGWVSEMVTSAPTRAFLPSVEQAGEGPRQDVIQQLATASSEIRRLARAVMYLGPLRDEPRVAYPLGHTVRALPVGERGEFTAAYLQDNHRTRLSFGSPDGTMRSDTFKNAVSTWSEYLGIAEQISVVAKGKLGHEIGLQIAGRARDPTMIGVGASQLLPVIVLVLGAPQGSIVLLEQPELHLHPKVQSRLADFFATARPDVRLIIETHSEYLVTRLRLRVAEGCLPPDDVTFLFASLRRQGKAEESTLPVYTEFRRLRLTDLGDFSTWPDDFFDTLGNDAVSLAQAVQERLRTRGGS